MDLLKHFQTLLTDLFKQLNFDSKSVRFLNNKVEEKETKEVKEAKETKEATEAKDVKELK
jgi:hypothetical protein